MKTNKIQNVKEPDFLRLDPDTTSNLEWLPRTYYELVWEERSGG